MDEKIHQEQAASHASSQIMVKLTRISWTDNDDSQNKEEDTNGGHVNLPEMIVKRKNSSCGN